MEMPGTQDVAMRARAQRPGGGITYVSRLVQPAPLLRDNLAWGRHLRD